MLYWKDLFLGLFRPIIMMRLLQKHAKYYNECSRTYIWYCIAMYLLYSFKIIRATEKFKAVIFTATAGIAIFYLIAMVLRMFGMQMAFLHEGSHMGIGFSLVVVAIAALNLILDFDMIEQRS